MKKDIASRCKKIKLVITDVDGVLTDGGMYYTDKGDVMRKFFVRDGMGVTLLRQKNISTVIVTKERVPMVKEWAKRVKISGLYDDIKNKEFILDKICKSYKVSPNQVAYIGDDVNDVGLLKIVGLSATPNDGSFEAKKVADYICKTNSGCGAFRDVTDLILKNHE